MTRFDSSRPALGPAALLAAACLTLTPNPLAGQLPSSARPDFDVMATPPAGWRPASPDDTSHVSQAVEPGQTVRMALDGGQDIQAEVLAVQPTYLYVDVQWTFGRSRHRLGPTYVPTERIESLRVVREGIGAKKGRQIDWAKAGETALTVGFAILYIAASAAH